MSPIDSEFVGIPSWEITALNSGTVLKVSAIDAIGGFNSSFWLDYLDHWLFNRLYRFGYSIYVLNVVLRHELSVQSMGNMAVSRYRNILSAEREFYRRCRPAGEKWIYRFRLVARAMKMLLLPARRRLFFPTLKFLRQDIFGRRTAQKERYSTPRAPE